MAQLRFELPEIARPVVDPKTGMVDPYWYRFFEWFINLGQTHDDEIDSAFDTTWTAGVGLGGGGTLNDLVIQFYLDDTAVTPGTYGSASSVPRITVDAQGRLIDVALVPINTSQVIPLVTGEEPVVLVSDGNGQIILVDYT